MIPDRALTLREGALKPIGRIDDDRNGMGAVFHRQVFRHLKMPLDKPWHKLTKKQQTTILYGTGEKRYKIDWGSHGTTNSRYEGLVNRLMRRFRNTRSEGMKRWYSQFLANTPCTSCNGVRLRPESAAVKVGGATLVEVSSWTIDRTYAFFAHIDLPSAAGEIATEVLKEICNRLAPGIRRPLLPFTGPPRPVTVWRRIPAHPPRQPGRIRIVWRHLYPG